jgi:GNAT superfamily N-acetyltransferase
MEKLEIIAAQDRKAAREFMTFPYALYRRDPHWVPPLWTTQKQMFETREHPFLAHAEMQCFVARRARQTVGRIAALIDRNFNQVYSEQAGFFGFFESVDDAEVASSLLEAAWNWLEQRGARFMRGPMNPSANYECGLLVDGFDSSPVILMTYNPRYYAQLLEQAGLRREKDLYAYYLSKEIVNVERAERVARRALETAHIQLRPIRMKDFESEVERVWEVYNSAWSRNWGFVPMTREECFWLARELKPIAVPELVLMAEVSGRLVGFLLALPDINQALKHTRSRFLPAVALTVLYHRRSIRTIRAVLLGVLEEFRTAGIAAALYAEVIRRGIRLGYGDCEMSWILDDNAMMIRPIEALGGQRYKTYRIYQRG